MSLQVEKLEKNMAKLTVEVSAEEFEAALNKARGVDKQIGSIVIHGNVSLNYSSNTVAGARVRLYQDNEILEQTWTNSSGKFYFFGQAPGHNYRITVHHPWYAAGRVNNISTTAGSVTTDVGTIILQESFYTGIDTVFLLDDSSSISSNDFSRMINETRSLFLDENAFTNDDRIGLFTFNSRVTKHFSFLNPLLDPTG